MPNFFTLDLTGPQIFILPDSRRIQSIKIFFLFQGYKKDMGSHANKTSGVDYKKKRQTITHVGENV